MIPPTSRSKRLASSIFDGYPDPGGQVVIVVGEVDQLLEVLNRGVGGVPERSKPGRQVPHRFGVPGQVAQATIKLSELGIDTVEPLGHQFDFHAVVGHNQLVNTIFALMFFYGLACMVIGSMYRDTDSTDHTARRGISHDKRSNTPSS